MGHATTIHRTTLGLGLLLASPACIGGQTGDGEPSVTDNTGGPVHGGEGAFGRCEYEAQVLAGPTEAVAPLDFSPAQIIALAEGTHVTSLRWGATPQLSVGPETGEGELTLEVGYDGGDIRVRQPVEAAEDGSVHTGEGPIAFDIVAGGCPPAYEIDAELRVRTRGGALDERFDTTLVAQSAMAVRFEVPLDLAALNGSLEARALQPEGAELKQVSLSGTITPLGSYGGIGGVIQWTVSGSDDGSGDPIGVSGMAPGGGLASWPADNACVEAGLGGLPVEPNTGLAGTTVEALLVRLTESFPRELTWQVPVMAEASAAPPGEAAGDTGSGDPAEGDPLEDFGGVAQRFEAVGTTELDLALSASGGCASVAAPGAGEASAGGWRVEAPVTIEAATGDGIWQLELSGMVTLTVVNGEAVEATLDAAIDDIPPGMFEASAGMSGVDLEGYDGGALQLFVDLVNATGSVEAMGLDVADCVNNPPEPERDADGNVVGTPGCRGTERIVLRRGEL